MSRILSNQYIESASDRYKLDNLSGKTMEKFEEIIMSV